MLKKFLSLLTCTMLIFASTTIMAATTKPVKKTTIKKVTAVKTNVKKTTTKKVTVPTGSLQGAITYQEKIKSGAFNSNETKVIISQDYDTSAYLVSKKFVVTEKTKDWWLYDYEFPNTSPDKRFGINVYATNDHTGKGIYGFYKVPVGDYVLIVITGKARNLQKTPSTECPDVLKNFFLPGTYSSFISSHTVINKHILMKTFEVTIKANQTQTLNYEFPLDY